MSEGNSVITEQLSEGPSNGGITESVPATGAEQPGEGPGNGGIPRSATGKKGVKRKYEPQTFEKKYQAVLEVEKGQRSKSAIAKEFNVPASTLSTWLKNADSIKESYLKFGPKRKNAKIGTFDDVENAILKWFSNVRDQNVPVSGPILLAKAEEFARKLNIENFKASSGWLEHFKERNGITFKKVCGEAKLVDTTSANMTEWEHRLGRILDQYSADDIYNADETGVFYRLLPDKTLEFKKVDCHGGKKSKERLTALVCANMTGNDKLPLLIIGKSANPRCFKNKKTLPTPYTSNKKAWMTSEIFTDWLRNLDQKLQKKKRKIAMVVDNCPAHPHVRSLKNIELVFLPPNTTSKTQPMDQGVIQNFKTHYRKRVILRQMKSIDEKKEFSLSILDAMRLMQQAWESVQPRTISNCFRHANFHRPESETEASETTSDADDDAEDDIPLARLAQLGLTTTTMEEYMMVDDNIPTSERLTDSDIIDDIISSRNTDNHDADETADDGNDDDADRRDSELPTSLTDAMDACAKLRSYFEQCENSDDFLISLGRMTDNLMKQDFKKHCGKQTLITGYFQCRDNQ